MATKSLAVGLPVVLLALLIALLAATTVWTPLSNDAGAYLTVADGWLHGQQPYRDLFDHKPPGIYAVYALVLRLGNGSLAAVQGVQIIAVLGMAALVGWTARRCQGRLAATLAIAAALYGAAAYQGGHLTIEVWSALLIAAALAALLNPRRTAPQWPAWALAGFFIGLAALFKQTAVLNVIAAAVAALLAPGTRTERMRRVLLLATAAMLPWLITVALFAVQGVWPAFWRDVVWLNLTHYPRAGLRSLVRGNLINLWAFPVLWIGLLPAGWQTIRRLPSSAGEWRQWLLWLMLLAGLLPLLHRSYGHYVLQSLPAAALLAAEAFARLWRTLAQRPLLWRIAAVACLLAGFLIHAPMWPRYLHFTRQAVAGQQLAAAAMQQIADPGEAVLALPAAAEFYFLSERPPAARWLYLYPVNTTGAVLVEVETLIRQRRAAAVLLDDNEILPWSTALRAAVEQTCRLHQHVGDTLTIYDCH